MTDNLQKKSKEQLYVHYIPKIKGEQAEFKIVKALKKCMFRYRGNNNIISSPGYLSTQTYIQHFVDEFSNIIPFNDTVYIGYFKGMNKISNLMAQTLIGEHYNKLQATGKFNKLKMKISNKADHRKMMFIYGINNNGLFNFHHDTLNLNTKDKFLDSITVNAVLLGSSNQSYSTYYGGRKGTADKGEADILLFTANEAEEKELSNNMYVEDCTIFKGIIGSPTEPYDYLKNILDDFLSSALDI